MSGKSMFSHMVYFTLKDASQTACDELVAGCKQWLTEHPGTAFFAAGTLANTTREVNDRDYHVALNIIFKDRASHDAYQVAERHDKFIAEHKHNWQQVRVFDSDVEN